MTIIKVSEDKISHMAECAEKMLRYGGKLMSCLDEMQREGGMGERAYGMGHHYPMGERDMNYRYPMGERDMDYYGERQGVRGTGPYSMYR